jgi:hypothetical protein
MPYKDKEKRKQYRKEYYERTKEESQKYYFENKEKYRERNRASRGRNDEFINQYKLENGCSKCGYNKHHSAIDFHHIEEKSENISRMAKDSYSIKKISEEMSKCILLCANCHREEHYKKE